MRRPADRMPWLARLGPGVLRATLPAGEPASSLTVFDDGRTAVDSLYSDGTASGGAASVSRAVPRRNSARKS